MALPRRVRELALFAGGGGGVYGSLLLGHDVVGAVEFNPYRRALLLQRQRDAVFPMFPIWDDIRTATGAELRRVCGPIDLISGGFPCQPFSSAGKRAGESDPRNMWPDTARIIREVRPRVVFLENVPALLADRYFGRILGDLAEGGYGVVWDCFSASAVGAPHQRDRLWIYAAAADGGSVRRMVSRPDPKDRGGEVDGREAQHKPEPGNRPSGDFRHSHTHHLTAHLAGPRAGEDGGERTTQEAVRGELADADEKRLLGDHPEPNQRTGRRADAGANRWWSPKSRIASVAYGLAQAFERLAARADVGFHGVEGASA